MNTPDPRDIRAIERHQQDQLVKDQLEKGQHAADIAWLMANEQGRRIVSRLLDLTGIESNCFTGNSTTFYNEGRRSVGVTLLSEVKAIAWSDYLAMLKEQRK